jgi:hypothetical protein
VLIITIQVKSLQILQAKIYLYLPQDSTVTSAKTADNTYTGNVVTTDDGEASAVFEVVDIVPPGLTAGQANRTGAAEATVTFTSDESGEYYYAVTEAGAEAPNIDTSAAGTASDTSEQTISLASLTAGAKDIYIVVKDASGNVSDALKIEIPAFMPGVIQFESDGMSLNEGFNGWTIYVTRTGGSDGAVSVDYNMVDGSAIAGTHYTAYSGTLTWADGDSGNKAIRFTASNDNVYNGCLDMQCVLSDTTGGAVLGERSSVNIQIRDNDNPPTPTGLRAVAGNGQVTLSWDSVKDARYRLYYSTEDGNFTDVQSHEVYDTETRIITGLTNGTTYYFAIKAGHDIYFSELSDSVSAIPKAPVAPPVRSAPQYDVRDSDEGAQSGGGHAEFSKKRAKAGETVTFTSNPDIGYESGQPSVYDRSGNPVPVTDNGDGSYSFKMPAGGADVETTYNRIDYFDDVNEDDWFDEAAWYCAAHGLMQGTEDRQFDGHADTTRAMLVTVLYRLANSDDDLESIFDDVESGKWYSKAIGWATHNEIVEGYGDGNFGPDDVITREQMVSVLYRYTLFMEYDVSQSADLSGFADAGEISKWALEAMQWAIGNGIVEGIGNDLISPKTGTTRAQFAAMMQRYALTFLK